MVKVESEASTKTDTQRLKPWRLSIRARTRPRQPYYEFDIVGSNGLTRVLLAGGRVPRLQALARERGEMAAAVIAVDWMAHIASRSNAQLLLSPEVFDCVMGEAPCPARLRLERAGLLRRYAEAPNVAFRRGRVERNPAAQERLAA